MITKEQWIEKLNNGVNEFNIFREKNKTLCPDLREANLWGADLWGANLREADLRGADLRGADLRGADLWGVKIEYTKGKILSFQPQCEARIGIAYIIKDKDNNDVLMFRLGCHCDNLENTLIAVERKYGKDSDYYDTIIYISKMRIWRE